MDLVNNSINGGLFQGHSFLVPGGTPGADPFGLGMEKRRRNVVR